MDEQAIRIEAKIETLQYILDYECDCRLPNQLKQHIKQLIKEYKILLDELQPVSNSN